LDFAITCAGGTHAQYTLSKPKILNTRNLKTLNTAAQEKIIQRVLETLRAWWQSKALVTSYLHNQRNQRQTHSAPRSRTFRPYKQHTPMHVEVRHGKSKENARFKPRALGGNRKLWSPAICAIKEISARRTGRRDLALSVRTSNTRPCTLKCGMANQERTHGSNLARLVAIESPGHQLSAQSKKSAPRARGAEISLFW
jgi:hypothetical protein